MVKTDARTAAALLEHAAGSGTMKRTARRAALLLGASLGALSIPPPAVAGGPAASPVAGPAPLSPAWFAARQGGRAAGAAGAAASGSAVPAGSLAQVQQSIDNMKRAAQAINAAQALQSQARAAALTTPTSVPDGLVQGGLQPVAGAAAGSARWVGANLPTQTSTGGRTAVTVRQTAPQAILNWTSFNVGRNTDLTFDQSGGNQPVATAGARPANAWTVLNRVDAATSPSRILGSITAQGQVLVINQNGILFGGSSQIDVNSLLASTGDIADKQFLDATAGGIYANGTTTDFTGLTGSVVVQAGATIATYAPATAANRGGFVLLLGAGVDNGGAITTPDGQTELAAGSSINLQPGFVRNAADPQGNTSTTLGNVVAITGKGGLAENAGLIQATTGDVTLSGKQVVQSGVVTSTTSVTQRGTVHLIADSEKGGAVTLAAGAATLVTPDLAPATAVDATRSAQFAPSQTLDAQRGGIPDRSDLSRIEITSGGGVEFQGGSLTLATGGQIAVSATAGRIQVDSLALLDAAGALDVTLPASANTLQVDVQGFQLRDAPTNRDSGKLSSEAVTVDASQLVLVPAQPDATKPGYYPTDRYYTPGGLLEVSGELGNVAHGIAQWLTPGGVVTLSGNEVVAQANAVVNIAGGSIRYQPGLAPTTWLTTETGQIYNIDAAPANVVYTGVYRGVTESQPRWNVTKTYGTPLVAPAQVLQPGYSVGKDGGDLVISAPTAVFEATVNAGVVTGERQTAARPVASTYSTTNLFDPYALPAGVAPIGGGLLIGDYVGSTDIAPRTTAASVVQSAPAASGTQISIAAAPPPLADSLAPASAIPIKRIDTIDLSAPSLDAANLGALSLSTTGPVTITAPLALGAGGTLTVIAPSVLLTNTVTTHGGAVSISNTFNPKLSGVVYLDTVASPAGSEAEPAAAAGTPGITLTASAAIDTQGLWTNAYLDPDDLSGEGFVDGGSVTLDTTQNLRLAPGSAIDASAGGALSPNLVQTGGAGGGITLIAFDRADTGVKLGFGVTAAGLSVPVQTVIGATLTSAGFQGVGGGALAIDAPSIAIGGAGTQPGASLTLPTAFFRSGFSSYALNGYGTSSGAAPAVSVAAGADVQVTEPVYMAGAAAATVPTGGDPAAAFQFVLPPLYLADPAAARLTQRKGASVTLSSEPDALDTLYATTGFITIGSKATIAVDPGAGITVQGNGQITVLGTLEAPGGAISVLNTRSQSLDPSSLTFVPGLSIWLGPDSRLDVAARASTAQDRYGRQYGMVPKGGTITLGTAAPANAGALTAGATDAFVIARPGSVIDASGASAQIDQDAGLAVAAGAQAASAPRTAASDAGSVLIDTASGVYLDGALRAAGGGPHAAGGTLSITLATPNYGAGISATAIPFEVPAAEATGRDLVISQATGPSRLAAGLQPGQTQGLVVGQTTVSAQKVQAGGFAALALAAGDAVLFDGDVSLATAQSVSLTSGVIGDTSATARVAVSAPYIQLNGLKDTTPTGGANSGGDAIAYSLEGQPGAASSWNAYGGPTTGTFTASAQLVDVSGSLYDGIKQSISYSDSVGSKTLAFQIPGFSTIAIASGGDVRFVPAASGSAAGASAVSALISPGDVVIDAAQVYPVYGDAGYVVAGFRPGAATTASTALSPYVFVAGGAIRIGRSGGVPAIPLTANGSLLLASGTIVQNGVLRAPDGVIQLGVTANSQLPPALSPAFSGATGAVVTGRIELGATSITSVSGLGAAIPFGGTPDGVDYTVAGKSVVQPASGSTPAFVEPLSSTLAVGATSVAIDPGAVVDLRGGGELTGASFVTGRGGSTDVLGTPLLTFNPAARSFNAGGGDQVFAVIPGSPAYAAPAAAATGADATAPAVGEQITLAAGAAGLPAGTYTLLPAIDALLPGGFRVEIGAATLLPARSVVNLGNGSAQVPGLLGVANTPVQESQAALVTVTPGSVARTYSSYTETSYSQFVEAQAALFGQVRSDIPEDAKRLILSLAGVPTRTTASLSVRGSVLTQPAAGGFGAEADVTGDVPAGGAPLEITPDTELSTATAVYVQAADLNALGASTLVVGGTTTSLRSGGPPPPQGAVNAVGLSVGPDGIVLRSGAALSAAEVFLVATNGGITIEQGAAIDTVGRGAPALAGVAGVSYQNGGAAVLAVSNEQTIFGAPTDRSAGTPSAPILIGGCVTPGTCSGATGLFSEGSLTFSTTGAVSIADSTQYGARYIDFSVGSVNVGSAAALARAVVPAGLTLTQQTLSTLLAGDPAIGTPPLQTLTLTANQSVNFYGTVDLNTLNPATRQSTLQQLTLNTPSIYGYGSPGDAVTVATGTLTWNGVAGGQAAGVISNGPGTGAGALTVSAQNIVLGYGPNTQPAAGATLDRTLLGFSDVTLQAARSISGNNAGTLSVYQSQTYTQGVGFSGSGGSLALVTPLLTGAANSTLTITSGGALSVRAPEGAAPSTASAAISGAALTLNAGGALDVATAIVLPSGKLSLNGAAGVTLEATSRLDVSGRPATLVDAPVYGFGGSVSVASSAGDITQQPGATVDVSATGNTAGSVTFAATAPGAGVVTLNGAISGASVPTGGAAYASGAATVDAQSLVVAGAADGLTAFNKTLDAGGVFGARSFDLKTGSYTIAGVVKAASVDVSVDAGSLTVSGMVDASGAKPGAIRLSASQDLTLTGSSSLLAQSTVLQTDSTGAAIASENRATVELTSAAGTITLAPGATIDVGDADGVARGTVTLNAPRTATGAAVSAPGAVAITGAAGIVVNGFRTYAPTDAAGSIYESSLTAPVAGGIDLDAVDADSRAFIASAQTAGIGGLTAYGAAFQLRPGVEIDSSTATGGDLTVQGDLDLSGYRYGPAAAGNGTGEAGALVLRASNNLNVYGSVTDGFAPPAPSVVTSSTIETETITFPLAAKKTGRYYDQEVEVISPQGTLITVNGYLFHSASGTPKVISSKFTPATSPASPVLTAASQQNPDDDGFVLLTGSADLPKDVILPASVFLAGGSSGTTFANTDAALNFAIPLGAGLTGAGPALKTNVTLPADIVTGAAYTIPAGTVVRAPILDGGAVLVAAGTLIGSPTKIPAGSTVSAGNVLPVTAANALVVAPGTVWPAGASLGDFSTTVIYLGAAGATAPAGALIPAGANVQGGGGDAIVTLPDGQTGIALRGVVNGAQGAIYALGQLFPAGTQSWSLRLVSGADAGAADQRAVQPVLQAGAVGNLTLSDPHVQTTDVATNAAYGSAELSVVRTGTGDLDLIAGGSIQEGSPFGVYTAGAQTQVASAYSAPRQTQAPSSADLPANVLGYRPAQTTAPVSVAPPAGSPVGTTATEAGVATDDEPYESYVSGAGYQAYYPSGGGDVLVSARGDVTGYQLASINQGATSNSNVGNWLWRQGGPGGQPSAYWINFGTYVPVTDGSAQTGVALVGFSGIGTLGGGNVSVIAGGDAGALNLVGNGSYEARGLDVAVASSGLVANGALTTFGGGALNIAVGGALDTAAASTITDLRGAASIRAGSIGIVAPTTSISASPAQSALIETVGAATSGGVLLTPGDSTITVSARGDVVLTGVQDATLAASAGPLQPVQPQTGAATPSSYSLWQADTETDLFSAGGNVAPGGTPTATSLPYYPPVFRAVAAGGSIYGAQFILAPSASGRLELLALASVLPLTSQFNYDVAVSGADRSALSSPLRPEYAGAPGLDAGAQGPFAFGADTATGTLHAGDGSAALIYAATGDVLDLSYGVAVTGTLPAYISGQAVRIVAGRDVVNLGRAAVPTVAGDISVLGLGGPSLIVNDNASDVSVVQAGRDIIYPEVQVAGPGQLYVQAGRNVYLGSTGLLQSVQPLAMRAGGAGITVAAGVTAAGPDWSGFAASYLDPAAAADAPYLATLDQERQTAYGASGTPAADAAFLAGLSPQAQGELIEPIYFDILRTSGRQFNDPTSVHYKSYITGRQAIAAVFPSAAADGGPIVYDGSITLFPPAGASGAAAASAFIRTDFGGDVNLLAPGGEVLLGSNNIPSPGGQGVLTQGLGNIDVYAEDSVLLGLSRIFTTFGGGITIWSAQGDINAGRGAGGTQGFSPVSITYDQYGDIAVAPSTTTTGAGIATLAPIAGVPAGDVDLIAPLGTIDAGEAGIRVSGNVNLAALTIANAANIQVSGRSTGIPTVTAPNVAASVAATAATAGTAQAAEDERKRREQAQQPAASLITVEVTDGG